MVQVVAFPSKDRLRREALDRFAARIAAHMAGVFFAAGVLDIPAQRYAREMADIMVGDGFAYEPDLLDQMAEDPAAMARIEAMFIRSLKARGLLPTA